MAIARVSRRALQTFATNAVVLGTCTCTCTSWYLLQHCQLQLQYSTAASTQQCRASALTASKYRNDVTGQSILPRRWCLVVGPWWRRVSRSVVEAGHAEVIGGATCRCRPVVRVDASCDAISQRHPLTDSPVIDDVVVCRTIGARHRPRYVKTVFKRSHRQVKRRRRPIVIGYGVCCNKQSCN